MSSFYDDLLNYPAQVEGIESYLSKLRTKTDMILSEANNVTMNGNSTALLDALKDIPGGRCPVGIALLLSFQADTLNGSSFPMFLFVCKTFFTYVPKSHVGLASKEGLFKLILCYVLKRLFFVNLAPVHSVQFQRCSNASCPWPSESANPALGSTSCNWPSECCPRTLTALHPHMPCSYR